MTAMPPTIPPTIAPTGTEWVTVTGTDEVAEGAMSVVSTPEVFPALGVIRKKSIMNRFVSLAVVTVTLIV